MSEAEDIEYKESTADKEGILKAVNAFANTNGGRVLIGFTDKGELKGQKIGKTTVELLARWITEENKPAIYPSIKVKKIEEKEFIEITVAESERKPHFYKKVAYLRIGRICKGVEPHELEKLIRKKFLDGFGELSSDVSIEEIDEKKVIDFINMMRYAGRRKVEHHDLEHSLKALGVYKNDKLLNAGVMVFGKDPYVYYPQLAFRCVYRSGGDIRDYLFATGTFFEIEKDLELFLERNLKRKVSIEKFERKESLEVPIEALREAVYNSLIHRDYFHPSGNYLEITDEEITVKNPGQLPEGLKISKLYKQHDSIPRNKTLASLAYLAGKIEQWGEGTLKIVEKTMQAGLKKPVFMEKQGFFYVVFRRAKLGEKEERILSFIKKKKKITSADVAKLLKTSERSARLMLNELIAAGLIKKHGKTKGVFYSV